MPEQQAGVLSSSSWSPSGSPTPRHRLTVLGLPSGLAPVLNCEAHHRKPAARISVHRINDQQLLSSRSKGRNLEQRPLNNESVGGGVVGSVQRRTKREGKGRLIPQTCRAAPACDLLPSWYPPTPSQALSAASEVDMSSAHLPVEPPLCHLPPTFWENVPLLCLGRPDTRQRRYRGQRRPAPASGAPRRP